MLGSEMGGNTIFSVGKSEVKLKQCVLGGRQEFERGSIDSSGPGIEGRFAGADDRRPQPLGTSQSKPSSADDHDFAAGAKSYISYDRHPVLVHTKK